MNQWVEGQVISQFQWTDHLFSLYIEAPILPFEAGQFTQLSLEKDKPQALFRPYSFVNAPDERPIEFYYNLVPHGSFSSKLAHLQKGDPVWVKAKSSGFFVLSTVPKSDVLWLFATGTALGVFLSILKTPTPWQNFKEVVLVHSVHTQAALTHQDLLQQFQEQYHGQFHYLPIVTRDKMRHLYGDRITKGIVSGDIERLVQLPLLPAKAQVMLCGNPSMVKEVTALLTERDFTLNRHKTPGHITLENYWK